MKKTLALSALMATTLCASAAIPVVEENNAAPAARAFQRSARIVATEGQTTFFEGFEGRPEGYGTSYDEWLPAGWQDVSKVGSTPYGNGHNLTWRVLSNESRANAPTCGNYAFEGECFAFIMADVAYGTHLDLTNQDEWLVTPAFTVQNEDWLNFQLFFNAAWTLYDSSARTFTKRNNNLEVYATTDNGTNWTKLWSLIDDEILPNWTEDDLRNELTNITKAEFTPIFVNLKDYVGQSAKLAFRYFGNYGHPMAIDNVLVGVPEPTSKYVIPHGFFKQGISPYIDYPQKPTLLIPHDTEATWVNKCNNFLSCDWAYSAADGSDATSQVTDLVTPAYPCGSMVATPALTAAFESRHSEPWQQGHSRMQAGGILTGNDNSGNLTEFGMSHYDIADPTHRFVISRDLIGFHPDLDLAWEMRLGRMDGSLDIDGYANFYASSPRAWGFDFIDVTAYVPEHLTSDAILQMEVYRLNREGMLEEQIGIAWIDAQEVPSDASNYVNLHFDFPVPVYVPAGYDIITLLLHSDRTANDKIYFPFAKTMAEDKLGNSLLYVWAYDNNMGDWYDTFYNLNNMALNDDYYFAGLVQGIGASYSDLKLTSGPQSITVPMEGGTYTFTVESTHPASRIKLTENGCTEPDWVTYTVSADKTVTITVDPTTTDLETQTQLHITSPGSRASINVTRQGNPELGIANITADPDEEESVYDLLGRRVVRPLSGHIYVTRNGVRRF